VQPLAPNPAYALLRCPVCRLDLAPAHRSLVCRKGHTFDLAKSGYVNLLRGRGRLPSAGGDTRAQLLRRDAFLSGGHFDFVSATVAQRLAATPWVHSASHLDVLDAGCGTGYHLGKITGQLSGLTGVQCRALGIDLSKAAAQFASRRLPHFAFAVTDVWADWPVRTASADLAINIFAPKNFREMARVLRPTGLLAVAYPGPSHLVELRRDFELLRISPQKPRGYLDAARNWFEETRIERVGCRSILDRDDVLNLIMMGPSATRAAKIPLPSGPAAIDVTFDVELLFARSYRQPRAAHPPVGPSRK